ncbi:hypothetical protein SOVF_022330 [Spinacia oleracea]|nr:hypothetical protein SOVF_022330 [Spinacia oleracea]
MKGIQSVDWSKAQSIHLILSLHFSIKFQFHDQAISCRNQKQLKNKMKKSLT